MDGVTHMAIASRAASARRGARPDQVYRKLRELIVRGQLAPGSRLVETDAASKLGVSRTPVRAALHRLQQEGYIVDSPALQQSRPTVAPLTKDDARELFHIVAEVEGLAARWAAGMNEPERTALADELQSLNDQFRRTSEAKNPNHNRLWELDERFHRRYVEVGSGPRLLALHDMVKPQAERYERLYVSLLRREISTSVGEHNTIVKAIRSGDPDAAQKSVQTNWRNAAERLGRVIETMGERGQW
jgi:DNA-binding GntR family transcriptional regulator